MDADERRGDVSDNRDDIPVLFARGTGQMRLTNVNSEVHHVQSDPCNRVTVPGGEGRVFFNHLVQRLVALLQQVFQHNLHGSWSLLDPQGAHCTLPQITGVAQGR